MHMDDRERPDHPTERQTRYNRPMFSILFALFIGPAAEANMARVVIDGMVCVTCQDKIVGSLEKLPFVVSATASTASGQACAELGGPMQEDQFRAAITQFGYTIKRVEDVTDCDPDTNEFPEIWADTEGLDAEVISRGEKVELEAHLVNGKWTIFDFGAPWCGPCHASEKLLRIFLRDNDDVALRAVILDSQNADESYAMPIVQQHLSSAPGLPYFLVMDDDGKVHFRGSEVDKLLKKMDKRKK